MSNTTISAQLLRLGNILKLRRESIGMSRQQLAEKVGTRYDIICLYEQGKRAMRIDRLFAILDALGLRLEDDFTLKATEDSRKADERIEDAPIGIKAYQAAVRLSALNPESYQGLIRKIQLMIETEEKKEAHNK